MKPYAPPAKPDLLSTAYIGLGALLYTALVTLAGIVLGWAGFVTSLDLFVFVAMSFAVLGVVLFGRMAWADRQLARMFGPVTLLIVLSLFFLIPILEAFRLKTSNGYFMFGFVPWSDAEAYPLGGWQMLVDGTLPEWHQRRPINASFMELRLLLAGFNLHALVILNSVMLALAAVYAALELERQIGRLATVFFFVVLFGYAQPYLPSTLSEVLGLPLGLAGFAAMLRSARIGSMWLYVLGLAILSFALNARAGNYFVLPAIWLWGVLYLGRTLRQRSLAACLGGLAMLSGFIYSFLLIKVFGSGELLNYNANFGDTLYGLAKGGIGWHRAQEDLPALWGPGVDAAHRARELFRISIEEIVQYPLRFVGVFINAIVNAIPAMLGGPELHYLDGLQQSTQLALLFNALNLIGLVGMLCFAFDRRNALILLALIGFFLSIPFIWQDGGPRVLAASMAFVLFVAPFGLRAIGLFLQGERWPAIRHCLAPGAATPIAEAPPRYLIAPAVTLAVVALTPFALAGHWSRLGPTIPPMAGEAQCPAGQVKLTFDQARLQYVMRVHAGDGTVVNSLSDMTHGELQSSLSPFHIEPLFRKLAAPYTVFGVIDGGESSRNLQTVIWPDELRRFDAQPIWRLCLSEFPQSFTGYRGHVFRVERSL